MNRIKTLMLTTMLIAGTILATDPQTDLTTFSLNPQPEPPGASADSPGDPI
jgi:hypothetical protein